MNRHLLTELEKKVEREGKALTLYSLVNSGNLKPDIAAKELGISIREFETAMKEAGNELACIKIVQNKQFVGFIYTCQFIAVNSII